MQSRRQRASRSAEAMRVKRVGSRLVLPAAAQARRSGRDEATAHALAAEKGSRSLVRTLNDRSATGRSRGVEVWAEDESVFRQQLEYLDLSAGGQTKSTIAVDFSSDGKLFASTHGDHTVKITSFLQGKVIQTLRGHRRTPWTVKFHPKNSRIVASGCLGEQVKVWNASTGQCLHTATLHAPVISLSFHPSGRMIAMASSLYVYLWDYNNGGHPYIAWAHLHTLRCVRFTPDGNGIIVGAANSSASARSLARTQTQVAQSRNQTQRPAARDEAGCGVGGGAAAGAGAGGATTAPAPAAARGEAACGGGDGAGGGAGIAIAAPAPVTARDEAGGGGGGGYGDGDGAAGGVGAAPPSQPADVTFCLQVWDFSLEAALEENIAAAMTRKRVLLSQTLLYNDGGFDVSHDGLWLCAIACLREKAGENPPPAAKASRGSDAAGKLPSSAPATIMATVMEVEEAETEGGEGAAAAAAAAASVPDARIDVDGAAVGNPNGTCRGARGAWNGSNRSGPVMAPQNGSHLGSWGQQTPPVIKITDVTASTVLAPATACAPPAAAAEGAKDGSSGSGSGQCLQGSAGGREEGKQEGRGKCSVLAPWPSRARPRPYFSAAFTGKDPGKECKVAADRGGPPMASGSSGAAAEGSTSAGGVAGRSADRRNESPPFTPPPFTPSPRITLKRRLSGSWLHAVSGGRSSGGGGGEGGGGGGGGGGGAGSSDGFWGLELRKGGSPRQGSFDRGGGVARGIRTLPRKEARPPPPLPPPLPPPGAHTGGILPSAASPPFRTAASPPSLIAHPRQPPGRASPPSRASSDPSPATSSGGLRISLPLLLPPPPVVGPPAGEVDQDQDAQRRRRDRRQQTQDQVVDPELPSQPVFFLQVPATAAATGVAHGVSEGRGWDAQFLGAGVAGEGAVQEAPISYGRRFMARGSSAGEEEHGHGVGGRRDRNTDDAVVREGGGGGCQEVNSLSENSNSSGGDGGGGAPTSFGRTHRRVSPPVASSPHGKLVPHLVLVSLNLEGERGATGGGGGGEKVARVVRSEAMDMFTAKKVTSVKLSPSARYIVLGVGVRDGREASGGGQAPQQVATASQRVSGGPSTSSQPRFPLSSIYRSADLQPVNSMPTAEEDVNIACFHPEPGMGCVYGTEHGWVGLVRMAH